jgi:UDP-glucose 4-epimerase
MSGPGARREPSRRPRAIVTGGAGFIGGHLVDRLLAEGFDVLVVDDLSSGTIDNVAPQARLERRDVATAGIDRLFRDWRAGVVYHLAAQANVVLSVRDPLRDLAVNVVGTHRVAAASRTSGADRLVFVSSGGAIYGETRRPANEQMRPGPTSYYGVHKLAAEGHVRFAGPAYAIARPSNVYGPRQAAGLEGAVVAAFVAQAVALGSLVIHGDGGQTRDFVHVRDAVDALFRLGQPDMPVGLWNVASGRAVTIADLADRVERSLGRRLGRTFEARRPGDVDHSSISASRLRRLGWQPTVGLSAGLAELIPTAALGLQGVARAALPGRFGQDARDRSGDGQ